MTIRKSAAALAAGIIVLATSPGAAREPDGFASVQWEWESESAQTIGALSGRLHIVLVPALTLRDAEMTIEAPRGVSVRPVSSKASSAENGGSISLGDVPARVPVSLDVDVAAAAGAGGIASVRVHATLPDGTRGSDGAGIRVGQAPPPPSIRSGAAEFPAGRRP